ncbi:centromere protein P [Turdus rufiventris]|nr:centromere protein P [Turdus rufiventris]
MDKSIFQPYEDEIRALEEEIWLLTEKYKDIRQESIFFSDEDILQSTRSFQRETQEKTEGQESLSELKAQLESLEADLLSLMKFTGFHFTSHSKKTLERTRNRTVQKHRLSGKCHSLSFQLEFQLLEMQHKKDLLEQVQSRVRKMFRGLELLCSGDKIPSRFNCLTKVLV